MRGQIVGLSHNTGRAHIVRAALETIAHQMHDLQTAFAADGAPWHDLRIDGGMSANNWIAQDLADILGIRVERPADVETTALGAAMLAGVGCGLYGSLAQAAAMRRDAASFRPAMPPAARDQRLALWQATLAAALG